MALLVLAAAATGTPTVADEVDLMAEASPFSQKWDGRLARLIKEDGVFEIFKVRAYPIFYIEFHTKEVQSQALDRLGIFVESDRYHGKILSPQLMRTLSADALFDGHDYAVDDVARFYSYAAEYAIRLNPMEEHLKELLLSLGLLFENEGEYAATHRAALLAAVGGMDERYGAGTRLWVLDHEFRHGYYFVTLKAGVHEIWKTMLSDREKEMIGTVLKMTAKYNSHDPALMEREFHAMVFESRFEENLRSLSERGPDGPARATPAEVDALIAKLPAIRRAFQTLERRL